MLRAVYYWHSKDAMLGGKLNDEIKNKLAQDKVIKSISSMTHWVHTLPRTSPRYPMSKVVYALMEGEKVNT